MTTAVEARNALGWRYRRGIPTLVFLPLTLLFIVVAHFSSSLDRYVFELDIENRRDVGQLTSSQDIADAHAGVATPLDESTNDCWLELSRGRLGRDTHGHVELVALNGAGHVRDLPPDPSAAAEISTAHAPFCWRRTSDDRLVARGGQGYYVLKAYGIGAWTRGFGAFGALLFLFAFAGAATGAIVRRPAGLEVVGAASLAVFVEVLLLFRSVGWNVAVLPGLLAFRNALGVESAAMIGFAPIVFLLFMVPVAAGLAALVVAMGDEIRSVRRCSGCLGPSDIALPRTAPCPLCGHEHTPERVQWLVISATAIASGLCLTAMLHFGTSLGVFEVCTAASPTSSCQEAMSGATGGLFDWSYFGRVGLFAGDPGRLVVFRPALYLAVAAVLFAVFPLVLGRLLRDGRRTTLAVLPALWVTSLLVSSAIVPCGFPYFYFELIQLHFIGVIVLGVVGLVSATIGLRLRGSTATGILDDLTDDDGDRPHSVPPPNPAFGVPTPFRGAHIPSSPIEEAPLSADLVAALRKPLLVRYKWVVLGVVAVLGAAGGTFLFLGLRPTVEDRFAATPFGKALGDPLTRYCISMGKEKAAEPRAQILSADVGKQIGSDALDDLRTALDAAEAYEKSPPNDNDDAPAKALFAPINALDAKLTARGVLGHLAGYTSSGKVWLTSYSVHGRDEIHMGDASLRAVRGFRLDDLNYGDSVDFKAHESEWVTVSMDRIEAELSGDVLNAIVSGTLAKGKVDVADRSSKAELVRKGGALVGAEVLASSKLSKDEATDVSARLHQRNDWIDELKGKGASLDESPLFLSRQVATALAARRDDVTASEILKANDALVGYKADIASAADLLGDLEEDEFIVRLLEEKRLADTSIETMKTLGIDSAEMRGIASAELSKLARSQKCPRLALWRTAERAYGDGYSRAGHALGRFLLGALYKELGVANTLADGGALGDDDFDVALSAALEKSPADLMAAAARAYQTIFGQSPPPYSRSALLPTHP